MPINPYVNLAPYDPEQQALDRKRQIAQMLMQQSFEPIEQPSVPGARVSPWQGVAKLVQALMGGMANRRLDTQQQNVNQRIMAQRLAESTGAARALMPEAQGTTANLPMAPTQSMPVPQTLTPQDAQAQQLPGSTPYAPQGQQVTPEGSRQVPLPARSTDIARLQAFAHALASPDPMQQHLAEAQAQDLFAGQRESRSAAFESQQKALDRALEQQRITNAQQNYLSEATHRTAQEKIAQELEQKPKPVIVPEGGQMMMVGPEGQMTPGPQGQPKGHAKVNFSNDGIPYSVSDADKKEYVIGGPNMPPELKPLADSAVAAHHQRLQEQADIEARRQAAIDARRKQEAEIRNSEAPQQIKQQVSDSFQALDQIDNIRSLVKAKPQLLGPVIGRLEKGEMALGQTLGNPQDTQDAATLIGNLGNLLLTEARVASPGRSNSEYIKILKDQSAQIKQDPNIIEGFLRPVETRANIAITAGKRFGINLQRTPGGVAPQGGGLPAVGGTFNGAKVLSVTPVP